ncbi:MAG: ABC transporter ATP-binding protein, partial [Gluconacetobacter diazotrophicus]|nr:ABC transporter ATP-binding protein [Gluconacetobacter diazotrophicus]
MFRYVLHHKLQHGLILLSVVAAVAAVVGSSYAVHYLVDSMNRYHGGSLRPVWVAVGLLGVLIAVDNLAWRVGGWISTYAFVAVTGDLRRDLFRHLTGHAPAYFAERMPGTLAGRITATANAMFTLENLATWNVLPPCLNVGFSILLMITVSPLMAGVLVVLAGALSWLMFRLAAGGRPLHHRYASNAARVDGELLDIINNMPLVRAFGAVRRERVRFSQRMEGEMRSRGTSLRYLERLRLIHAVLTVLLTAGLLFWAILLWANKAASVGDVVMVTTLGF